MSFDQLDPIRPLSILVHAGERDLGGMVSMVLLKYGYVRDETE